jgi:hypothetical protein
LHAEQHWDSISHRWKNGRVSAVDPLVALGIVLSFFSLSFYPSIDSEATLCIAGWDGVLQRWGRARDPMWSSIASPKVGSKRSLMTAAPLRNPVARVMSEPPWARALSISESLPPDAAAG